MRRNLSTVLVLIAAVSAISVTVSLAGCADGTAPVLGGASFSGTYVLSLMAGSGPPFLLASHTFSTGSRTRLVMLGDTLNVLGDSLVRRGYAVRRVDFSATGDSSVLTSSASFTMRYHRRGDTVFVPQRATGTMFGSDTLIVVGERVRDSWEIGLLCQFDPTCVSGGAYQQVDVWYAHPR